MLKNDKLKLEEVQKRGANMIREMEKLSDKKRQKVLKYIWSGEMQAARKYARELNSEGGKKKKIIQSRGHSWHKNEYKMAMNKVRL